MAATNAPAPKTRSKMFRIAVEGGTTDGREIQRSWIEDMAATYNPTTYGARINCEHIKGLAPDSVFGSYGDVIALKAEEVDIAGVKKLALFAQIDPTESLIALNKKRQKIYTSAEIHPKLAITGKPYLVGLAITDNPASLGTEALQFSAQHGTLASRKQDKDNLFTAAEEVDIEFEEITETPGAFAALREKLGELLGKNKEKEGTDAANFTALAEMIEQVATHGSEQEKAYSTLNAAHQKLQAAHEKLSADFTELVQKLEGTPADDDEPNPTIKHSTQRPPVTGNDGRTVTDC